MKNFWPHRPVVKGFSIENLARKYRQKISTASSINTSNKSLDDRDLKSINGDAQKITITPVSTKRGHWANRDFSEYKEAA